MQEKGLCLGVKSGLPYELERSQDRSYSIWSPLGTGEDLLHSKAFKRRTNGTFYKVVTVIVWIVK